MPWPGHVEREQAARGLAEARVRVGESVVPKRSWHRGIAFRGGPPSASLKSMDGLLLDAVRGVLATREDVALAVVFGSFAKGTAREASDLDLAVLPTASLSLENEAQLVDAVERATNREVDLVRLDRTEDIVLRREIGLYGVAVREARPGNFARFRADAQLAWLDFAPTYLEAEARFLRRIAAGTR